MAAPAPKAAAAAKPFSAPNGIVGVRSAGTSIDDALAGDSWGIDSMASTHISGNRAIFGRLTRCAEVKVKVANGEFVKANQTGTVTVKFRDIQKRIVTATLDQVLYHPKFVSNLLCLARMTDEKLPPNKRWQYHAGDGPTHMVTPGGAKIPITTAGRVSILLGAGTERVFTAMQSAAGASVVSKLVLLHQRLSHMGFSEMIKLIRSGRTALSKIELSECDVEAARAVVRECRACILGKASRTALGHRGLEIGRRAAEVLHADSYEVKFVDREGVQRLQHGVSLKDTHTGEGFQLVVDTKDKVTPAVIEKVAEIERQAGAAVKVIHSDGGSEFNNFTMRSFASKRGILLRLSPPYVKELNGVAERSVRTYKDLGRTLLHHAGAPDYMWAHAMRHVVWLWNRTRINNATGKTAYEQHTGCVPELSAKFIGV